MPSYTPIQVPVAAEIPDVSLLVSGWKAGTFFVDLEVGKQTVRASFRDPFSSRILTNVRIERLEAGEHQGLRRRYFAYSVLGADFWYEHFNAMIDPVRHFRFVAGVNCVDVLSKETPVILVVSKGS